MRSRPSPIGMRRSEVEIVHRSSETLAAAPNESEKEGVTTKPWVFSPFLERHIPWALRRHG